MMFDILISKYLDGSLSAEEDCTLRTILSENPLAKEQFNLAISLHIAMKDEPELLLDDETISASERAIFASLMLELPKVAPHGHDGIIRKKRNQSFIPRIAAFVVLFILMLSSVTDLKLSDISHTVLAVNNANDESTSNPLQFKNLTNVRIDAYHKKQYRLRQTEKSMLQTNDTLFSDDVQQLAVTDMTADIEVPKNNDDIFVPFSVAIANIPATMMLAHSPEQSSFEGKSQVKDESIGIIRTTALNQANAQSTQNTEVVATAQKNNEDSENQHSVNQFMSSGEHKAAVHIRSFLNNGFVYGNNSSVNASSFSQSIGYDVKEGTKVGLEMGQVGFTYAYQTIGNGANTEPSSGIIAVKEHRFSKNMTLLGKEDNGNTVPVDNVNQESVNNDNTVSLYWGGAFIEQAVLNTQDIAINLAGGIGAAGSGPIIFARSYAEYKVNSTLSLTIVAEGKTFSIREGRQTGKSLQSNVMIALAYGLQIKL
ncbi:MAG: hypothetical protein IPK11_12045 [Ignavibacteria bacterium]|nr:hypothetical protein [Ignavibacteria bacterium]